MQLNSLLSGSLALLLTVISLVTAGAQDADLDDPVDTTDLTLSAKSPYAAPLVSEAELKERLQQLNGCLPLRVNGVVKGYIKTYVQIKTEKTRTMLGRRLTFFPIFDEKLKEHGLPPDLKYLSVVESALNAKAVSRVGATGLWQFMPGTGREYGLQTTSMVEDRSNPVESTDAAMRYLKSLYLQYSDWALALAAYNSGPTRVNSAIKRAHSRDFWQIQRFLPKETRNYVPAFIAATYICNFFQLHNITPDNPDFDEQLTDHLLVYEGLSFRDISEATGVDYDVVKNLNPGFKKDYVPASEEGYHVVMPQRVMPAFVRYLNSLGGRKYGLDNNAGFAGGNAGIGDGRYTQMTVSVQQNDNIDRIAEMLGCHREHLKAWNNLSSNFLTPGQMLKVWRPVSVKKHESVRIEAPATARRKKIENFKPVPLRRKAVVRQPAPKAILASNRPGIQSAVRYEWHTVQRNESLEDIARDNGVTADSIRKLNNTQTIKVGMRLKIKPL